MGFELGGAVHDKIRVLSRPQTYILRKGDIEAYINHIVIVGNRWGDDLRIWRVYKLQEK